MPRFLSLAVLLAAPPDAAIAESTANLPIAIVYSLAGQASLTAPGAARRPLSRFDRLPAGASVEVGQSARVELAFLSGKRYLLDERSKVTLGANDLAARSGRLRTLPQIPPLPLLSPIAPEDRPGSGPGAIPIRGARIARLYPRRGTTTLAGATVLRFQPVDSETRYRVEVRDRRGTLVFQIETKDSTVPLPEDLLQPDMRYDWTVRTIERAGPVAQGKEELVTLSAAVAEQREALRKALAAEGDAASLALLAEVDRSLGLVAEAQDELRAAIESASGDFALASALAQLQKRLQQEP